MALGAGTALFEGLLLQPTLYWKNARQQGLPFSLNPAIIYRGTGAALCNEIGQMTIQFSATRLFRGADSSLAGELGAAAAGGVLTAAFATPVELVMIQQQRHAGGLLGTPLRLAKAHGLSVLGRAFGLAACRDSIYTCGMLGVTPAVQRTMQEHGLSQAAASLAASVVGGVAGGVLSHPFDVVKTCMQGDVEQEVYAGTLSSCLHLYRNGGFGRLLHGVGWRTLNITATVFIANECLQRVPTYIARCRG